MAITADHLEVYPLIVTDWLPSVQFVLRDEHFIETVMSR